MSLEVVDGCFFKNRQRTPFILKVMFQKVLAVSPKIKEELFKKAD